MLLLLPLLFALALLPDPQDRSTPPEWLGVGGSIALTWTSVAGVAAFAAFLGYWTRSQLAQHPARRDQILHRYSSWRSWQLFGLLGVFGLALFGFGWGGVITPPDGGTWWSGIPGVELLILAPLFMGLILSWMFFYDVEKALHRVESVSADGEHYWSRIAYVAFHLRQMLGLVLVPILLLIFTKELPRLFPQTDGDSWTAANVLPLLGAVPVLAFMPWILRLTLGLKPMPDSPLRDRLLAAAKRLNFRCNGILIWNTRSGVANAMLVGVLPFLRYVLLTDRLVSEMPPDEVEAVFGHEVGHVKHRHLLYYLAFFMASVSILALLWGKAEEPLHELLPHKHKDLVLLAFGGLLGVYIVFVFGFLSRRCERQADVYGCRAVSCGRPDCREHGYQETLPQAGSGLCPTGIRTFISALEKVASLNGLSRDKPGWMQSWQHGTIARRVDFLKRIIVNPEEERHFQRRIILVKFVLFVSLGLLLLVFSQAWS